MTTMKGIGQFTSTHKIRLDSIMTPLETRDVDRSLYKLPYLFYTSSLWDWQEKPRGSSNFPPYKYLRAQDTSVTLTTFYLGKDGARKIRWTTYPYSAVCSEILVTEYFLLKRYK